MIWAEKKESDEIHVVQMRRFSSRSPHPDLALYGRPELVPHPGCIPMWKWTSLLRKSDLSSPINSFDSMCLRYRVTVSKGGVEIEILRPSDHGRDEYPPNQV